MPRPLMLTEARPQAQVTENTTSPGRLDVQLITPGWGSSGYYPAQVLEAAASDRVFPAGTHMFIDHPSESERYDRPERSVRDLAAVLTEDARWDGGALVAAVQVLGPYRELLTDPAVAEAIGVSIRAGAEVTEGGEAEGRRGRIVDRLTEGVSVDFVTRAGRGGRILQVLESARGGEAVERAVERGVAEATAEQTREQLTDAVRAAYGDGDGWAWVRDFDEATVWFDLDDNGGSSTYQQAYTRSDDDTVALSGDRTEVRAETTYVPVDPAGRSTPTEESLEDTMPNVEESRLAQLEEAAGRVSVLESERDTAIAERDTARREAAEATARNTARPTVTAVVGESSTLPARRQARVVEAVVAQVTPDHDEAAVRALAEAARTAEEADIADLAEALGAGTVRGFGQPPTPAEQVTDEAVEAALAATFGPITVKGA